MSSKQSVSNYSTSMPEAYGRNLPNWKYCWTKLLAEWMFFSSRKHGLATKSKHLCHSRTITAFSHHDHPDAVEVPRYLHNEINAKLAESFCDEYNSIVAVEIGFPQKIVLACIYRPPQTSATAIDGFLDVLEDFLARRGSSFQFQPTSIQYFCAKIHKHDPVEWF